MSEPSANDTLDPNPDEAVRQLELEVARRRARLTSTLRSLRTELEEVKDWRTWYERHPFAFMGGAAFAGFVAGQILFPRRS